MYVCCSTINHDHVIRWKHFPRYWPFVRGIHRSPVNSPHKGQWRGALMILFDLRLNKRLSKQSWSWWFETLSRPLWLHRNGNFRNRWVSKVYVFCRNIKEIADLSGKQKIPSNLYSTTMEPCIVWEFPSLPIGDPDCRDVIIEKPCVVRAQPTGNYAN